MKYLSILCVLLTGAAHAQVVLDEDQCTNSAVDSVVGDGAFTFDTTNATTGAEGQLETNCDFFGFTGVTSDVWFTWTATTDGTAVMTTCNTAGLADDTKMAVWPSTAACPVDFSSITCNDDDCVFNSTVSFSITNGTSYIIQLGHYGGGGTTVILGDGTLEVTQIPPPTPGCVDNWSFESGDLSGWTVVDHPQPFLPTTVASLGAPTGFGIFDVTPTEGGFALLTGFDGGGPGTTTISQDVLITAGLTPLSFDYRIGWDYALGAAPTLDRTFDFVVRAAGGGAALQTTTVFTAPATTLANLDTGSLTESIDLTPFIGQTVQLSFELNVPEASTGPGYLQLDNITCPSGNTVGMNYCMAAVNSTGQIGEMSATGSTVAADNNLTLTASNLPANQFGIFVTSMQQGFSMGAGGSSNGNICLAGTIGRYNLAGQILSSGGAGEFSLALDLTQTPQGATFAAIVAGQAWNFQAWHRDPVGLGSNFTNGLEISFQ